MRKRLARPTPLTLTAALLLGTSGATTAFAHPSTPDPAASRWQPQGVASVDNSAVWTFISAVTGNPYKLFISLPADYETSAARYPVLYLLDGNSSWLYSRTAIDRMREDLPGLIVVAIGYDGASQRWTDYGTPAKSYWNIPADKGAAPFLRAIKEEIFPFIDGKYRTDPSDRGLGGHSMGGFFTMWTLFTEPGLFRRYWISSPTVKWDDYVLRGYADRFAKEHPDSDARVYSNIGGLEDLALGDELESLRRRATTGTHLSWQNHLVAGVPHSSLPAADFVNALYALYGRPVTSVPTRRLHEMTGTYELTDKSRFTLRTDGKTLLLSDWQSKKFPLIPAPERVPVLAESNDVFFIRMMGIEFSTRAGQKGAPAELTVAKHFFGEPQPIGTARRVSR